MKIGGEKMEALKQFRAEKGFTREEMAERLNISTSLYDKIEYGDRKPSREFLKKFKEAFPTYDMNIFFDELLHESCAEQETAQTTA